MYRWYHGDQDDLVCINCARGLKHTDTAYAGSPVLIEKDIVYPVHSRTNKEAYFEDECFKTARIQEFAKSSEEMIRNAFFKDQPKEAFQAVSIEIDGERTLALIYVKNTKLELVDGIERNNGYWLNGIYCCDCDICNGGKCKCNHKFFLSNEKVESK
jgi:hypothetical protein